MNHLSQVGGTLPKWSGTLRPSTLTYGATGVVWIIYHRLVALFQSGVAPWDRPLSHIYCTFWFSDFDSRPSADGVGCNRAARQHLPLASVLALESISTVYQTFPEVGATAASGYSGLCHREQLRLSRQLLIPQQPAAELSAFKLQHVLRICSMSWCTNCCHWQSISDAGSASML